MTASSTTDIRPSQVRSALRSMVQRDFYAFLIRCFQTVFPGPTFKPNWHIEAIAYALMTNSATPGGRLLITQPPRSLKSLCTSVAYPAWLLGHDPSCSIICVSYASDLAETFARQFRQVVTSPWYRAAFPAMQPDKNTTTDFTTTKGGRRLATSVGGSLTGFGADMIIIDDPLKADEAASDAARNRVNDWYRETLLSRLNNKTTGQIVIVMQRLHQDDLAGTVLRADEADANGFDDEGSHHQNTDGAQQHWQHLDLPAIAIDAQRIPINADAVHVRGPGDVLQPDHEPLTALEELKRDMGSYVFSAQYQQRPVPREGNLIKRSWLKTYETAPKKGDGVQIVQSWDIATSTGDANDWSVCTTWAKKQRDYFLLHVWRGKREFPALKRKVAALAEEHSTNVILIEKAGPGQHLLQELKHSPLRGVPSPIGITPKGDKVMRV
ncbi:MAG: terminase family protein, partial [Pseudomonadota bacterium]